MSGPGYNRTEAIGAMKVLDELVEVFNGVEQHRTFTREQVLNALKVSRSTLQDALVRDLIAPPRKHRRWWG